MATHITPIRNQVCSYTQGLSGCDTGSLNKLNWGYSTDRKGIATVHGKGFKVI